MDQQSVYGRERYTHNNLKDFARTLNPDWDREDWFDWPPDLFALTSLFLKHTGAYRYAADPPVRLWPTKNWDATVRDAAKQWLSWILGWEGKQLPNLLTKNRKILKTHWLDISLDRLSSLAEPCQEWDLCRAMLELHALADCACTGFGHPTGVSRQGDSLIRYCANMLLATTGSLSRLPKHKVLVLPKMRTPRVGMTLRSLSHYVTAHESEVGVAWRSIPWVNIDSNRINVLVVPWPYEVKDAWFKPDNARPKKKMPFRYFRYRGSDELLPAIAIVEMVKRAQKEVGRVHMIVFPESAIEYPELYNLKWDLAKDMPVDRMPMIISGVISKPHAEEWKQNGSGDLFLDRNQVVLSTYFAGRWYDLSQDKHHRWKLDGGQIERYELDGVFKKDVEWWEAIKLAPRRITFLAPNGWLALCPLICEDLARLEPVSELIRGVGPTLAVAILLDGPQLQNRWPGRYASVLAEDPGTSVLTVSSLGMVVRSLPPKDTPVNRTVALWKDLLTGWKPVELSEKGRAVLLTVTADWTREFTADHRDDGGYAGLFRIEDVRELAMPTESHPEISKGPTDGMLFAEALDIEELTWFTFFVDACLDMKSNLVEALRCGILLEACEESQVQSVRVGKEIWKRIADAFDESYRRYGSERRDFRVGVDWLAHTLKSVPREGDDLVDDWTRLVNEVEPIFASVENDSYREALRSDAILQGLVKRHGLKEQEIPRIKIYSSLSILWAVHNRLKRRLRDKDLTPAGERLLSRIEDLLRVDYRCVLRSEDRQEGGQNNGRLPGEIIAAISPELSAPQLSGEP
ncbi:MAG TPA: hypothetical protein VLE27_15995 [Thermoanaerobaculia bacterium]|nr:hypothetical protein [Thermoanaerobaculia bacterium]